MLQYKKLPKQLSHFTKENILSTTHPIFCNIDHLLYDVHKNIIFWVENSIYGHETHIVMVFEIFTSNWKMRIISYGIFLHITRNMNHKSSKYLYNWKFLILILVDYPKLEIQNVWRSLIHGTYLENTYMHLQYLNLIKMHRW